MATYYGINAGGNAQTAGTWSTIATKDATRVGGAVVPTASDDIILDDYSGNITVGATCVAKTLNCTVNGNYAGVLTFNARYTISGSITFSPTMSIAGTNELRMAATGTLTLAGLTIPWLNFTATATITLGNTLSVSGLLNIATAVNITMAGAYNISCGTLSIPYASFLAIVAGQKITVTSALAIGNLGISVTCTLKSATASSVAYLEYTGALADCASARMIFTDIDFSTLSTPVTNLDNWYGGTLTRTTGITNRTSADILDISDADLTVAEAPTGKKFYAVSGGVKTGTGTKTVSNATVSQDAGYYAAFNLATVDADLVVANIKAGITIFGLAGEAAGGGGIFMPAARQIGV